MGVALKLIAIQKFVHLVITLKEYYCLLECDGMYSGRQLSAIFTGTSCLHHHGRSNTGEHLPNYMALIFKVTTTITSKFPHLHCQVNRSVKTNSGRRKQIRIPQEEWITCSEDQPHPVPLRLCPPLLQPSLVEVLQGIQCLFLAQWHSLQPLQARMHHLQCSYPSPQQSTSIHTTCSQPDQVGRSHVLI